jgi:hypothetical protein
MIEIGQKEFLEAITYKLDEAKINYVVCGSLVSSLFGEPRATNDVDIIIACNLKQLRQFMASFSDDYYADLEMAEDAFKNKSMFNIIDLKSGWKVDFIFLKEDEYSHESFSRRQDSNFLGINVKILTPEDVILSKLIWSKMGQSERQFRDALGVTVVQWKKLDQNYLNKWAKKLNVEDLLDKILREAEKLQD